MSNETYTAFAVVIRDIELIISGHVGNGPLRPVYQLTRNLTTARATLRSKCLKGLLASRVDDVGLAKLPRQSRGVPPCTSSPFPNIPQSLRDSLGADVFELRAKHIIIRFWFLRDGWASQVFRVSIQRASVCGRACQKKRSSILWPSFLFPPIPCPFLLQDLYFYFGRKK